MIYKLNSKFVLSVKYTYAAEYISKIIDILLKN